MSLRDKDCSFWIMKHVCEFCQKGFSNKSNLLFHQNNARYCIESRKKSSTSEYNCEFCESVLANKYSLRKHYSRCSDKKLKELKDEYKEKINSLKKGKKQLKKESDREINDLKKDNKQLKKEVDKLRVSNEELKDELFEQKGVVSGMQKGPGKTYNAYIHPKLINLPIANIPALTHEYVEQKVSDGILTYEKAAKGYSGMLDVICDLITHENDDGIIERSYVCTDVSRNSFHRLLESRKWKADKGGRYLNEMLDRFQDRMEEYKNKIYEKYSNTPHDSIEWDHVDWERKKISQLYSGVVCKEGTGDREELVNALRKEIAKRASV